MTKATLTEAQGQLAILGNQAQFDRVFIIEEDGQPIAQALQRLNISILDDRAPLPDNIRDALERIWTPEMVQAAQVEADRLAAEIAAADEQAVEARRQEEEQRLAAEEAERDARRQEFEKLRLAAFDAALKALLEQRDIASSSGDLEMAGKIQAQHDELEALRDQGKTIEGQDPPAWLESPAAEEAEYSEDGAELGDGQGG